MQDPNSPLDTLRQLKEMLDAGALTTTEFEALKQRLVFSESPTAVSPPPVTAPPVVPPTPVSFPPPMPPVAEAAAAATLFEPRPEAFELPAARFTTPFPPTPEPVPEPIPAPVQEPLAEPVAEWPNSEFAEADVPPARNSPLGLIIAIGAVLAFLAVVAYLSMNRPPSEHISSTSQTAADSVASAIETGPQAAPLPPTTMAVPETVRVAPAHPAPALPSRSAMAEKAAAIHDSADAGPAPTATDSATRP